MLTRGQAINAGPSGWTFTLSIESGTFAKVTTLECIKLAIEAGGTPLCRTRTSENETFLGYVGPYLALRLRALEASLEVRSPDRRR